MGMLEDLDELKHLLRAGKITPLEFEAARERLLGQDPSGTPVKPASSMIAEHSSESERGLVWGAILAFVGGAMVAVEFHDAPWDFIKYQWACCPRDIPGGVLTLIGTAVPRLAIIGLGILYVIGTPRREFRGALAAVGLCVAFESVIWSGTSGAAMVVGVIGGLLAFAGSFAWGRR